MPQPPQRCHPSDDVDVIVPQGEAIVPPATIGMLGGGQLGRYTLIAARQMGYGTAVLDPDPHAPAGAIADVHLVAPYDDAGALGELAATCAIVTTEFENPPASSLRRLAERLHVAPSPAAVAVAQDRRVEKAFLRDHAIPVGPFAIVEGADDDNLDVASGAISFPAILKTAGGGYDGKGQRTVASAAELGPAWRDLGEVPCVLEQLLALERELSVIVVRGSDGTIVTYEPTENVHVGGVLDVSVAPATLPRPVVTSAVAVATSVADALDYVGVLGVELFVVDGEVVDGEVVVNELAPRPHNSGHWTLDAASTSQFAQQVRAVCGLPLGPVTMTAPAVAMANVLGDLWAAGDPDWSAALAHPDVRLHLYGKREPRPGRKMGHLTATAATAEDARRRVLAARTAAARGVASD